MQIIFKQKSVFFFIVFSFTLAISYIIIYNNSLAFWILFNILFNSKNSIEINIIILNYEQFSEQIRIICFFICNLVYTPFIAFIIYAKIRSSVDNQYIFHYLIILYFIVYTLFCSCLFNHNDFAYSLIIDIFIPNIVQKCVDFTLFLMQYKSYFYDFVYIWLMFIGIFIIYFISPGHFIFMLKTSKNKIQFDKVMLFRFINVCFIFYYFGTYQYEFNSILIFINLCCIEIMLIWIRAFNILKIFYIPISLFV